MDEMVRLAQTKDLTGKKFGMLTVTQFAGYASRKDGKKSAAWVCVCDCGNEKTVLADGLVTGNNRSCGCIKVGTAGRPLGRTADLLGQQFGRLTVKEFAGYKAKPSGGRIAQWKCDCECGQEKVVDANKLMSGHTTSCGCKHKPRSPRVLASSTIDLTGRRFGRWTVVKLCEYRSGSMQSYAYWECRCDCGTIRSVRATGLLSGGSKSCGCLLKDIVAPRIAEVGRRNRKPGKTAAINSLFNSYRHSAADRSLEFKLTREQFEKLILSDCQYCECEPSNLHHPKGCVEGVLANGVDRVDSKLGYTPENCVPCCKQCNFAKGSMSYDEFIAWRDGLVARMSHKLN